VGGGGTCSPFRTPANGFFVSRHPNQHHVGPSDREPCCNRRECPAKKKKEKESPPESVGPGRNGCLLAPSSRAPRGRSTLFHDKAGHTHDRIQGVREGWCSSIRIVSAGSVPARRQRPGMFHERQHNRTETVERRGRPCVVFRFVNRHPQSVCGLPPTDAR